MSFVLRAASVAALTVSAAVAISQAVPAEALGLESPALVSASAPVEATQVKPAEKITFTSAEIAQPLPETRKVDVDGPAQAVDPISRPSRRGSLNDTVGGFKGDMSLTAEERCLAGAVYFESKGEPLEGQMAVAHVVLNRVDSGRFAGSICGVVYQKSQFSFVRGGRMPSIPEGSPQWQTAVAVAKAALTDSWDSPVGGALYFHADYVSPGWKRKRVRTIGNHIFYR